MPDPTETRVLVTGGCGFIGSHLVRAMVRRGHHVLNVDGLSYAADPKSLSGISGDSRYQFLHADIRDATAMREAFARWRPRRVIHLAAESHVDRSIHAPGDFLETNILGTANLLRAARECFSGIGPAATPAEQPLFIMLSTDEVYGALEAGDPGFSVASPYAPNSPYSASKAAADHLARAWATTYGLPVVIAHATNTHGTHQHPEKLIPRVVTHAIDGREIPIFGSGRQSREWLHVDDLCDALLRISDHASPGDRFHIASGDEWENLALVNRIIAELHDAGHECPAREPMIRHVADRPGHDFRYALECGSLRESLGWRPRRTINCSLGETVRWYLDNRDWWQGKE